MVCYRQLKGIGTFARDELSISLFQGFTNMLYIYRINSLPNPTFYQFLNAINAQTQSDHCDCFLHMKNKIHQNCLSISKAFGTDELMTHVYVAV